MKIKIGITGGIGSGKSVVSHLLEIMGIPVYISDIESKRLTLEDEKIRKELNNLLGNDIYKAGQLNKTLLASYIFGNQNHAEQVNQIIHPCVKDDFRRWSLEKNNNCPFVAIESAILIEAGFSDEVDVIIMVYAPLELRLQRAMKRDNSSEELIRKRIQSQMDDEKKAKCAHYVVYNDDVTPLIPQIQTILDRLKS